MDRLTSMAVFVRVVELGSFAAAAKDLGLSPQMVAKHVVHLENRVGATLLHRTTRRQSLTDLGRAYFDQCKRVIAEADMADALADEVRTQPSGRLRVAAPVTFGTSQLAPFITAYLHDFPNIQIDLILNDRIVDPLEEGVDVVIRIGALEDSRLIGKPLAPYRLIACAAPDYLARHGTPKVPQDLIAHNCLGFAYWSPSLCCQWTFSNRDRLETVNVTGTFRSNNWAALLSAAIGGAGITLGPEIALHEALASGRLVQVLPDYQGPERPLYVLYPANRRPTAKMRHFIAAMKDAFGPNPARDALPDVQVPDDALA
ncbi:LysR family transcriptional regulator [Thalassospira profundimaris]|uniref:LysR family transcriptional regulator n=1 Tax=Thalassospira profundimaris TaxID=502049 RepID=UPI000DEDF6F2|nr:LysR family transcriptional regulator [Thalassospira profundimaris]